MAAAQEPPERDVKDFEFRQLCKCRVYPSPASEAAVPVNRVQLLASSSKFGFIFCASNNEIKVLRMAALSQKDQSVDARERSTGVAEAPCEKHFSVPAPVVHIGISCDDMMLSVVTDDNASRQLMIFSIGAFADQRTAPAPLACHQVSSGPHTLLKDLTWNPAFPLLLALCLSDGSITLLEVGQTISVKAMATLPATCLSWSPKGKQIMVGKFDGSCSQYDHEFKLKKEWPAPSIFSETHQVTDMVWISTYTFLASYLLQTADPTIQPVVVMTVSNKEGNHSFINFDDICFGSGENRQAKYYFHYLIQWEMIVMTSCTATETTVVARHLDDKTQWEHWNLEDSCRAELPVTDDQMDSFPLGMSVTLASQQPLQLGESKTHPPCPVLLLLSTDGVLVPFHMAYFHAQAPVLTAAPQPLLAPGSQATAGAVGPPAVATSPPAPAATQAPYSALASLLTTPSTLPSLSVPAPAPAAAAGIGQTAVPAPAGTKPLFTMPSSAPSFTQPAPSSSASSTFSFTPTGGAASGTPGTSASSKPAFNLGSVGAGTEGSQTFGAAGFGAKPPGSTVKANLFGAFTATVPASTAAIGGTPAAAAKLVPPAGPPAGQPAATVPGTTADTAPKLFSFGSDSNKPGGDGLPSMLGPRPTGPIAGSAFGATGTGGAGFGQFSFSFKGTPTTSATPAPASFPPPALSSVASAGTGFSSPAPLSVSAPAPTPALAATPAAAPAATAAAPVGTANSSFVKAPATPARNGLTGVTVATSRPSTAVGGARKQEKEFDAILDSAITQNIAEEIEDFEKELQSLRARLVQSGPLIGTKAEMESLWQNTSKMETFCKEITSMTKEHCREMYDLKGSCLDMFAMAEECRCRQDRNNDPQYVRSLQQRTLDPATAQRLRRLRQTVQQIGQSLQDSDAVLDSQWEAHVEKEKKTRIHIPNCDTMYRAIKSNHNVLVAQHHELDRVQDQLRRLQIKNRSSPWDNYSSYAKSGDSSSSASVMPSVNPNMSQDQRDWRLKKADLLTPEKVALLKESLANHRVRKVKCQPLVSLSHSRLVSVRSELRTSSVVSSDGSLQAGSGSIKDGDIGTTAAAAAGAAAVNRAEGRAGPVLTSTPATQLPAPSGKEAPRMMQPPTSFSGVAYFKPKPTMPDTSTNLPAQPGFAFSATPAGAGAIFKNPQVLQQGATTPGFGASSFSAYPSSQPASAAPVQPLLPTPGQDRFETVTPTSFVDDDETYDEDEDYAGYDEEDEEEDEEEEEVGFGDQYEYPSEDAVSGSTAGGILTTPGFGLQAAAKPSGSGVSKNLFNVPAMEAGDSASSPNLSAFGAGGARGSHGFAFGAASTMGSASLMPSQLSGKPLFGSADTTGQDGGTKTETGDATPAASSALGSKQEAPVAGFGATAPKTTSVNTPTTTSTTGLFGLTASTIATADSTTSAANTSTTATSKPAGGLFGFSTVPATTASSTGGLFGVGSTFGSVSSSAGTGSVFGGTSSAAVSSPGSPPVGFFASADSTSANTTTTGGFSFTTNPTTSATTQPSSVFGTSGTGSSVFGSSASSGAFSFTSLISKAEAATTATSNGGGGDAGASSSLPATLFGKPAVVTAKASASSTDVKTETPSSVVPTTATASPSFGGLVASTTTATAAATAAATPAATATTTTTITTTPTTATATATTTAASVSSPSANATTVAPVTSGGFLGAAPTKSPFAATVASSVPASGASLFGAATSASPGTGSVFGSTTLSSSAPSPGLFGAAATTTSTSVPTTGLFGAAATTSSTSVPTTGLFGAAATTTSTSAPTTGLFGAAAATTTALTTGLFGTATATTTAPAPGLFGAATTTTTAPTTGLFGVAAATTTAPSPGLFGSAATTTTSTGLFGSPITSAPAAGLFGSATTTTTSSGATPSGGGLFAAPAATTSSGTPSLFPTATSGGGSLFGVTPASSGGSVFGSSSSGGQTFGSPATTATSVFGASTAAPSSEATSLGFEPAADTSASLGFGLSSTGFCGFSKPAFGTAPTFGQTAPGFGQSASSSGGFGQTQTPAASGFGSSGFGQTATTTTESGSGGGFGGLFGGGGGAGGGGIFGLGAKPSEEKAKQNVFGTVQSFGTASAANNSLFGNKGPTVFGGSASQTATSGSVFGGSSSSPGGFGATQTSGSGVASMGFAVTQSTSSSVGGFGNSPGFGSSPSFGGSAFGSAPSFGGSPGFGGGGGMGPTTGSAFGSNPSFPSPFGASQQTPTSGGFSSFAATDAPSFGSLAQVSDLPTFGNMNQGATGGFGGMAAGPQGGGGFGAQSPGFGTASPGFGGGQQAQQPAGFGNTSFGSSPSFSSYRG